MGEVDCAWCVAETHPSSEELAARAIQGAGFETWLPMFKKRLSRRVDENGRRIRSRNAGHEMRPLFRGYVFLLVPHGTYAYGVNNTCPGVRRMMRHPPAEDELVGKPKIIRARVIIQLQEAVEAGIWEDEFGKLQYGPVQLRKDIIARDEETQTPGSMVRTPTGFVGEVLSRDSKGRANLLAEVLGAKREIPNVSVATLELVGT